MNTEDEQRRDVLLALGRALVRLTQQPLGSLIPEVRSNLGYAMPAATSPDEVAAVPGRLTHHGEEVFYCRPPAFGASRHVARIILTAMRFDPSLRSAMNIRFEPQIIDACRCLGYTISSFDRADEPSTIKELEGKTLEWGTHQALSSAIGDGRGPTPAAIVYDVGDFGKEPMTRVIGRSPDHVVDIVSTIFTTWRRLSDVKADPKARHAYPTDEESPGSAR